METLIFLVFVKEKKYFGNGISIRTKQKKENSA